MKSRIKIMRSRCQMGPWRLSLIINRKNSLFMSLSLFILRNNQICIHSKNSKKKINNNQIMRQKMIKIKNSKKNQNLNMKKNLRNKNKNYRNLMLHYHVNPHLIHRRIQMKKSHQPRIRRRIKERLRQCKIITKHSWQSQKGKMAGLMPKVRNL